MSLESFPEVKSDFAIKISMSLSFDFHSITKRERQGAALVKWPEIEAFRISCSALKDKQKRKKYSLGMVDEN